MHTDRAETFDPAFSGGGCKGTLEIRIGKIENRLVQQFSVVGLHADILAALDDVRPALCLLSGETSGFESSQDPRSRALVGGSQGLVRYPTRGQRVHAADSPGGDLAEEGRKALAADPRWSTSCGTPSARISRFVEPRRRRFKSWPAMRTSRRRCATCTCRRRR